MWGTRVSYVQVVNIGLTRAKWVRRSDRRQRNGIFGAVGIAANFSIFVKLDMFIRCSSKFEAVSWRRPAKPIDNESLVISTSVPNVIPPFFPDGNCLISARGIRHRNMNEYMNVPKTTELPRAITAVHRSNHLSILLPIVRGVRQTITNDLLASHRRAVRLRRIKQEILYHAAVKTAR